MRLGRKGPAFCRRSNWAAASYEAMPFPQRTFAGLFPGLFPGLLSFGLLLVGGLSSSLEAARPQTIKWVDSSPVLPDTGSTFGAAWARGTVQADSGFELTDASGKPLALQSWVLATWPDGSLKWTGHAFVSGPEVKGAFQLTSTDKPAQSVADKGLTLVEQAGSIEVDTGPIHVSIPKSGPILLDHLQRDGKEVANGAGLVLWLQDQPVLEPGVTASVEAFHGEVSKVVVEQTGPVRAVVCIEGTHRADKGGRAWLPFKVRLYFYAKSPAIRVVHTIVFDGDENKDFIKGLGFTLGVPLHDELYNRHVRFATEGEGLFAEGIRGITGLRRTPGIAARAAQIAGKATPPPEKWTWDARTPPVLDLVPAWGDYSLSQLDSEGFVIKKRTKPGYSWIKAAAGKRAEGLVYVGGVSGGVTLGLRDFWQKYPAQLDVRGAAGDRAELTAWLWAPDAQAMDLRFYHDGMGMDTHEKEILGLNITYEDYEKGFGTPLGVARTSELMLWLNSATPAREQTVQAAHTNALPPQATSTPEDLAAAGVFGLWALPDRSTPEKAAIEARNEALIDYYRKEVDVRDWYGFWDFGDVMHSYDSDRHVWRYDVGGYAWDNSELSPDLWLWYSYLRTGKATTFRFAEAMTRHTGEVDVHHIGRFQGLGSRHNVLHWGCSAKQMRISNASYRRFYYFLTGDERTGDLLTETVDAAESFLRLDPRRKVRDNKLPPPRRDAVNVGFGTDWGAYSGALLTEWERTGSATAKSRLEAGMRTIAAQPRGFFTGDGFMDIDTAAFAISQDPRPQVSHLSAVFGLPEVCAEVLDLIPMPSFEKAWLEYCELYNASPEEQKKALGRALKGISLRQGHSRLTAFAALRLGDKKLLKRAWSEFGADGAPSFEQGPLRILQVSGPASLRPLEEIEGLSTNGAAQWGLAAIQVMAAEVRMKQAAQEKKTQQ